MKKKKINKNETATDKIIKIIYFDENSAIDYINISRGGNLFEVSDKIKKGTANINLGSEANISSRIGLPSILNFKAKASLKSEMLKYGENYFKTSITNTILTDFISLSKTDEAIKKFEKEKISFVEDSMTYIKTVAPYTYILKEEFLSNLVSEIDFNRIDELLKEVKGYYEFIATNKTTKKVFRFNISSFKNNYKISNLLNMDLVYYCVLVGKTTESALNVENELSLEQKDVTLEELKGNSKEDGIYMYDVILAGVKDNYEQWNKSIYLLCSNFYI